MQCFLLAYVYICILLYTVMKWVYLVRRLPRDSWILLMSLFHELRLEPLVGELSHLWPLVV